METSNQIYSPSVKTQQILQPQHSVFLLRVCVYMCVCLFMCMWVYVCACICMHLCKCVCMCVHVYVYSMCVCIYLYICVCSCICVHGCNGVSDACLDVCMCVLDCETPSQLRQPYHPSEECFPPEERRNNSVQERSEDCPKIYSCLSSHSTSAPLADRTR